MRILVALFILLSVSAVAFAQPANKHHLLTANQIDRLFYSLDRDDARLDHEVTRRSS